MVLRCAWGTCNGDERYPERQGPDGRFILFPKPKTEPEKCLRWIKACGRPHEQLNINKINKHKAVYSKHFVGGKGPTELFPDPIQADGSTIKPSRPKPKRRCESPTTETVSKRRKFKPFLSLGISGMDMFILAAENHELKGEIEQDYPNTIIIIDGTEFKTHTPCALGLQSQLYSDYKSSTTLKALVGCDPNGSVTFISELFTGSISDKAITEQSGFYDVILSLKSKGYINDGNAVMADKGFTIKDGLAEFGIALNIPPHASSGKQMSVSDTILTQKIAKHRVHIERLIAKIKTYKIISDCIPTSLFQNINKIWSVCSYLTLFQDVFVKD
ncbi:hypothetical protein FSP39_011470 [Pinctada imbricata]|uniref:DDE Tnp4 domain-containing protein n=1 Tax=Pinctada imbricata TaxID=66713 RepID=A0AA88YVU9_PINIB|nr:hypothetical protein FSP39_011470 [Pinctada imbricata]